MRPRASHRRLARLVAAVLLAASAPLGGCATLEHGTMDDVAVVTQPAGATVSSSTGTICASPCTVSGPRNQSFVITVVKAGFATQTAVSEAKPDAPAIAAASTLAPTLDALGRVIDVQDGTYYRHEPKALVLKLVPVP